MTLFKSETFKKGKVYLNIPINPEPGAFKVFSKTEGPRIVLAFFTFSGSSLATKAGMRMSMDDIPMKDSMNVHDGRPYYGFFGLGAKKLESGSHTIRVESFIDNTLENNPNDYDW
jgi:hypothetical protein